MSKVKEGLVRGAFVLGVAGALVFGGRAAFAADRASDCLCDPVDPDANLFCIRCCVAEGSICPLGGTGERECLCV